MNSDNISLAKLSPAEMSAWLGSCIPGRAAVVLDSIEALQGYLYPEEDALIPNAIPKRSREFRSGRTAARKGLLELGLPPAPILAGEKREPLWPEGCVGTISHCGGYCLVIVSSSEDSISLGADIEQLGRVQPHLWPRIFTGDEKACLGKLGGPEADRASTAMFSAKEAFFKLQHPLTGLWLEFLDAEVRLEPGNSFSLSVSKPLPSPMDGQAFRGSYAVWRDCCIAVMGM